MIPEEIRDFLSHEGGNSLIIQGKPGAGKTILALELMDAFPDHNPLYVIEPDVSRGYKDVKLTAVR